MKKGKKTFLILILVAGFLAGGAYLTRHLIIKDVTCKSQYGPCRESLEKVLKGSVGKSLFKAREEIKINLENELLISDFSIHFALPNRLQISVLERKANFALANMENSQFVLVDKDGYVLSIRDEVSLPVVKIDKTLPNVEERVSDEILFSLKLTRDMYSSYQTREALLSSEGLVIDLKTGEKVIFPLGKDRQVLLASLDVILSKLNSSESNSTIGKKSVNTIDLRFENPVVR